MPATPPQRHGGAVATGRDHAMQLGGRGPSNPTSPSGQREAKRLLAAALAMALLAGTATGGRPSTARQQQITSLIAQGAQGLAGAAGGLSGRVGHRVRMIFPLVLAIAGRLAALLPMGMAVVGLVLLMTLFAQKAFLVSMVVLAMHIWERVARARQSPAVVSAASPSWAPPPPPPPHTAPLLAPHWALLPSPAPALHTFAEAEPAFTHHHNHHHQAPAGPDGQDWRPAPSEDLFQNHRYEQPHAQYSESHHQRVAGEERRREPPAPDPFPFRDKKPLRWSQRRRYSASTNTPAITRRIQLSKWTKARHTRNRSSKS